LLAKAAPFSAATTTSDRATRRKDTDFCLSCNTERRKAIYPERRKYIILDQEPARAKFVVEHQRLPRTAEFKTPCERLSGRCQPLQVPLTRGANCWGRQRSIFAWRDVIKLDSLVCVRTNREHDCKAYGGPLISCGLTRRRRIARADRTDRRPSPPQGRVCPAR
jgi:hypothetical protein